MNCLRSFILILLCGCAVQKPVVLTPNISAIMPVTPVASDKWQVTRSASVTVIPPPAPSQVRVVATVLTVIESSTDLATGHWIRRAADSNIVVTATQPKEFFRCNTNFSVLHLAWDASPAPVAGYKIYSGPSPGNYIEVNDVSNVTDAIVVLHGYPTNYIAATSYTATAGESDFSSEIARPTEMPLWAIGDF